MKKLLFIILAFILLMGCKPKYNPTTVMDFEVKISRVESHRVWVDIFPQDEFLRYNLDWMPASDWSRYASADEYKKELNEIMVLYTDEQYKKVTKEGAYLNAIPASPATEYCLIITGLDANRCATELRVVRFITLSEHISDFTLVADSIRMENGIISIHPADTVNTYFWDYTLKKEIDHDWTKIHSGWFYYDVEYYYQLDFLVKNNGMLSKGKDSENIFLYYTPSEIQDGDTITLLAVGYDETGETSLAYMPFWIIYHTGTTAASTVVEAAKDGYESVYRQAFNAPARSIARAAMWSQKQSQESFVYRKDRYIPQHIRSAKH